MRFSEVVATAKAQGYTEPDPRDDLSGAWGYVWAAGDLWMDRGKRRWGRAGDGPQGTLVDRQAVKWV